MAARTDGTEVFLVVEVSWGVGLYDLERAVRRALGIARARLRRTSTGAAGGEPIHLIGVEFSRRDAATCDADGVWLVLDGRVVPPNGTADSG